MEDGQVMLRTPGSLSTLSLLIRKCPTHYLAGDLPLTFSSEESIYNHDIDVT
ncbi:hypothetical protein L917_05644 [Phytophthora nicotianae]|uniref:Uncharacterized protein n=1 Tax=Phytophthora nicotianae TaxID=4792 RepID=W2LHQ7_PHYNI|nr:hypothetical protein L917_05644 [Phytophthora nicotianae]ETM50148.1 hypothetical protein L914_05768 [Phytophthora nicotianae]